MRPAAAETAEAPARVHCLRTGYRLRRQTVEPVFGVIKAVLGFTRFSLRGLDKVADEWDLVTLAYNCKRLHRLTLSMA